MNYEKKYYELVLSLIKNYERETPGKIQRLRQGQIFIFGTDKRGSQRLGAAGFAAKCCGAAIGIAEGLTGSSYALPTQGFTFEETSTAIKRFIDFVKSNSNMTFLVTPIGCGHAGFKAEDIAPFFFECLTFKNVWLPYDFLTIYRKEAIKALGLRKETISSSTKEDVFEYYDPQVHNVIRVLLANNISFNHEGGFCLKDEEDIVIAEAELGIESEKIVFFPFNSQSELTFKNHGYKICTPEEYLNTKL